MFKDTGRNDDAEYEYHINDVTPDELYEKITYRCNDNDLHIINQLKPTTITLSRGYTGTIGYESIRFQITKRNTTTLQIKLKPQWINQITYNRNEASRRYAEFVNSLIDDLGVRRSYEVETLFSSDTLAKDYAQETRKMYVGFIPVVVFLLLAFIGNRFLPVIPIAGLLSLVFFEYATLKFFNTRRIKRRMIDTG